MYRQTNKLADPNSMVCPECGSKRFRVASSSITCTNCGWTIKRKVANKYGAVRTEFKGKKYDSKYEAGVAAELDMRKQAGDIIDFDTQFKAEMWCYCEDGTPAFKVSHKVDFRVHHKDGSYELLEAKGVETDDYKWRKKFIENVWLHEHKDYIYTVVKQHRR